MLKCVKKFLHFNRDKARNTSPLTCDSSQSLSGGQLSPLWVAVHFCTFTEVFQVDHLFRFDTHEPVKPAPSLAGRSRQGAGKATAGRLQQQGRIPHSGAA